MRLKRWTATIMTLAVLYTLVLPASAGTGGSNRMILVPSRTPIYFELTEKIVSKKKAFPVNTTISGRIWRDVIVDGEVVIPEGTSVEATISAVSSHKPAGVPGSLRIAAQRLNLNDGRTVALTDGYYGKGDNAIASTIILALLIAWPLIFLTGENVVLEQGAVLEAYTNEAFEVAGMGPSMPDSVDSEDKRLNVAVRTTDLDPGKRLSRLPMNVTVCGGTPDHLAIDEVNGQLLRKPLKLKVVGMTAAADGCRMLDTKSPKRLRKKFRRGINYFDVMYQASGQRVATEVIFEREL